ncbi:unnamed protein product [Triticum turgidum subsp. durum]|uniref:Uncharacterized protein n=1 Tax=Triticum turgidum subsp. durum TaxID=4567 RepID=A0A9R0YR89_TRITD|nr:unnamed protein product [Triticum turgidum subsp. durum]
MSEIQNARCIMDLLPEMLNALDRGNRELAKIFEAKKLKIVPSCLAIRCVCHPHWRTDHNIIPPASVNMIAGSSLQLALSWREDLMAAY